MDRMEEIVGSESSSGCESGWTLYLEHPSYSFQNQHDFSRKKDSSYETSEDDMSMVSDASSGPQHFPDQEHERAFKFNNNVGGVYTNGKSPKQPKIQPFLDDTASSPFFNFSINPNNLTVPSKKASVVEKEILDYSQGYSATYFKGKSFEDEMGVVSGAEENQWLEDKRWG